MRISFKIIATFGVPPTTKQNKTFLQLAAASVLALQTELFSRADLDPPVQQEGFNAVWSSKGTTALSDFHLCKLVNQGASVCFERWLKVYVSILQEESADFSCCLQ